VRHLIINADDFGLTTGVNRAIEEAGSAGALTSATLMANSGRFEEAIRIARSLPQLRIGCHIVLIDGEPVSGDLPSLTGSTAKFKSSLTDFMLAAIRGRLSQAEIQREAEAQIGKIQSAGVAVTHVDTHKHTHIFPQVLQPVLRAAKACGIRAIRNPFEPFRAWPLGAMGSRPVLWKRAFQVGLLQKFSASFRESVDREKMITTDGIAGVVATGHLDQELLLATLDALPYGDWELVCHPGYMDADLCASGTRLLESRRVELDALLAEQTKQALAQRGVALISYEELGK
jgi:hopanoid biosynthesis associated protein HpnK